MRICAKSLYPAPLLDIEITAKQVLEEIQAVLILVKIIDSAQGSSSLQGMLIEYVETAGEYEYLYTCEECGDRVCSWTIDMVLD